MTLAPVLAHATAVVHAAAVTGVADDTDLLITTHRDDAVVTVAVVGEVDISNATQLSAAGLSALESGADELVVDLTAVTFMDSTGLGHLVRVLRAARPTPVQLLVTHPHVLRLFEVTGLTGAFRVTHLP